MDFVKAKIMLNQKIAGKDGFYRLLFAAPQIAAVARSGQFLMIPPSTNDYPFLKRPMGINSIDREEGLVGVIYQTKGSGTKMLSQLTETTSLNILGPLGNGWQIKENLAKVCLVGGGSGIGPLLPLAQELKMHGAADIDIIIGGKNSAAIVCEEDFRKYGNLLLATEDGSAGTKGMASVHFSDNIAYDYIYSCGPTAMMKAVAAWAEQKNIPCQVSLEERMGCGYGVCVGCVCKAQATDGTISHKRICCDGPVFPAKEVFFHD